MKDGEFSKWEQRLFKVPVALFDGVARAANMIEAELGLRQRVVDRLKCEDGVGCMSKMHITGRFALAGFKRLRHLTCRHQVWTCCDFLNAPPLGTVGLLLY